MALPLLVWIAVFVSCSLARPEGPPPGACALLRPQHDGTTPQTSPIPVDIIVPTRYTPGGTIQVTLAISNITSFRGFMIQARSASDPNGSPLGSFTTTVAKAQTQSCVGPDDTAAHANGADVFVVTVLWIATADIAEPEIKFYYTVVQNFTTYWVKAASNTITVSGVVTSQPPTQPPTTGAEGTGDMQGGGNTGRSNASSTALIKAHASFMTLAWGLIAPVGIILAMFYKVIWPNGEWFYAHIVIMSTTLFCTIVGLILIVVHSGGRWLTTTELNLPHQVLGLVVCVATAVNPFLAIIRCDPQSQWRWAYNWAHGSIGFILGLTTALLVMLLGLNIFRELAASPALVHYAICSMSATVGLVLAVIALYNLYAVNYHKYEPKPTDLAPSASEPPGSFPEHSRTNPFGIGGKQEEVEEEELEATRDYPLRAAVGIVIMVVLTVLALATIILLALA